MSAPRLECFGPLRLFGLMREQNPAIDPMHTTRGLAAQWSDFIARLDRPVSPSRCLAIHEGMQDGETHFRHFTGTYGDGVLPAGLTEYALPELTYAVFSYEGHVSGLRAFTHSAFVNGLPGAGLSLLPREAGAPEFIERYLESFDPVTRQGGIEILIPVRD